MFTNRDKKNRKCLNKYKRKLIKELKEVSNKMRKNF